MCAASRCVSLDGAAGGGHKFQLHSFQLISFQLHLHGDLAVLPGTVKNAGRLPFGMLRINLRYDVTARPVLGPT